MQDNTESKRLYYTTHDGQEFILENDKTFKVKETITLNDGQFYHIVNEAVFIPDIEDRPPYDTILIMDRRTYYQECIEPNPILKEWYYQISIMLDGYVEAEKYNLGKKYITDKIFDQYSDTEYYIRVHIQDEDWFESITDFIGYNIDSFGMTKGQASGFGAGVYIQLLVQFIKNANFTDVPNNKYKLLDYLTPFVDESLKSERDCKSLILETYNKWLELFPFELSHFSDIREKYKNHLPLLYRIPPRINRFTEQLSATSYTQKDITSFLLNETDKLHREFNGTVLFEKGLITNDNKVYIELINKTRLLKLEELREKTPFESTVLQMINHWLNCEREYVNEVKNLIVVPKTKQVTPPPPPAKGFNLGYSVEQLTSLHKALIHENYLTGTVTDFINAFTGNPIKDKLEWIDKAQKVKSVNSHTLLQLLFSLNISLHNDNNVLSQNVRESIQYIFSNDFGNIHSKLNGFIESNTERQKNISTIVQKALNLN